MRCPRTLVFSAITVSLCLTARGLEWKSKVFEATTKPFQETVDAVFEFTNTGPKPVTVLGIDSGCDCVVVTNERTTHAPGAIGRIKVVFTVGDRVGEYERPVYLRTDEDPSKPVRLSLRITVPELAEIAPRLVFWKVGQPADERIIEIKIVAAVDLHLDAVRAMTDVFTVRLEEVVAGKHYRLHVKPRDTSQPISDALRIRGATTDGRPLILSAYAYVK